MVGVKKNSKAKKLCGFPKVTTDAIPTNGNQVGTAVELPNPTKCQESTYLRSNSNALSGATASAPPDNEPNLFREYKNEINNVIKIPNNIGCLTIARILLNLLVGTNSNSSKLSSITPISE